LEHAVRDWKKWQRWAVVSAVFLALMAGCRREMFPDRKPVVPVTGKIVAGGKPAAGAVVCFHPLDDPGPRALRSNGRVGADGSFALTTYAVSDGAPSGEYVVTIYWADPSKAPPDDEDEDSSDLPPDLLKGRFAARETSPLRARVANEPTAFATVDVQTSEVAGAKQFSFSQQ
jgi:hypothetical protein